MTFLHPHHTPDTVYLILLSVRINCFLSSRNTWSSDGIKMVFSIFPSLSISSQCSFHFNLFYMVLNVGIPQGLLIFTPLSCSIFFSEYLIHTYLFNDCLGQWFWNFYFWFWVLWIPDLPNWLSTPSLLYFKGTFSAWYNWTHDFLSKRCHLPVFPCRGNNLVILKIYIHSLWWYIFELSLGKNSLKEKFINGKSF